MFYVLIANLLSRAEANWVTNRDPSAISWEIDTFPSVDGNCRVVTIGKSLGSLSVRRHIIDTKKHRPAR